MEKMVDKLVKKKEVRTVVVIDWVSFFNSNYNGERSNANTKSNLGYSSELQKLK